MFGSVPTTPKSLDDYRPIVGDDAVEEIRTLAEPLHGARVLHLNISAFGTGLAELLGSLVPLMDNVGLSADWQVARSWEEFAQVSRAIYSALFGFFVEWTPQMEETWLAYNAMNARHFDQDYDFIVVHDPQPVALLKQITENREERPAGKWIWHCHLDTADAQPEVWDLLQDFIAAYDAEVYLAEEHAKRRGAPGRIAIIRPAIDPLGPKNVDVSPSMQAGVLRRYRIDPKRPIICQISRFDAWNDPLGVIDAYKIAKQQVPELQLILVASIISETQETWSYYERCARHAGEDEDIHLLSLLNGVGNTEMNVFQRAANVVIQKSVRKGFGMGIAEAFWKAKPVVAGRVGGFPIQVVDGVNGFLVDDAQECAERVVFLLKHKRIAARMGQAGKDLVQQQHLITRYLKDYIELFRGL